MVYSILQYLKEFKRKVKKMSFCLIVQKDTLENDKVKSIMRTCEISPDDFLSELQTGHCIEYQLLAYTSNSTDKMRSLIAPYKTNYGKDWYEFDHDVLAKILTLFLEHDTTTINMTSISAIMGFSLKMFPKISKEIRVSPLEKNSSKEIITLIETLEKSNTPRRKKDSKKTKKDV